MSSVSSLDVAPAPFVSSPFFSSSIVMVPFLSVSNDTNSAFS